MEVAVSDLNPHDVYRLLVGSIVPRPIAWVTSINGSGVVNAAPFSCYTFVSNKPPMVAINCGRKNGISKDTAANAESCGEFVLNVVSEDLIAPMHWSSAEYPSDVSEAEEIGIDLWPSRLVRPPRIAASPVNMECRLDRILEFGELKTQVLVGEILMFHIRDDCHTGGRIDTEKLRPLGRLGGPYYVRLGEVVRMEPVAEYFHYSGEGEN